MWLSAYLPSEEKDAQEVVKLIEKAGRKAYPIPGDITSEAFCIEMVEGAIEKLGGRGHPGLERSRADD